MKKVFARILACTMILLTALSCQKVEIDCIYTVRVYVQERQGGERIPAEDVKVYAFFVDPSEWEVAGADDARNGIITSKANGSDKRNDPEIAVKVFDTEEGETVYAGKNRFEKPFTQQNVLLVAAHDTQPVFAYGNASLQYNLDRMEVALVLELYRTDSEPYTQGLWQIHNEGTQVPVECAYTVTSRQKRVSGATVSPVALNSTRLHVLYLSGDDGDAANWKVTSYRDAVDGVLTNSGDPSNRKQAAAADIEYNANNAVTTITQMKTVLVVYDTLQPMYGYAAANLTNNPEKQSDEVTFMPYQPKTTIDADGDSRWTVCMEDTYVATYLTVSPRQKFSDAVADSNSTPLTTTKGYVFYADSTEWSIFSYEDALAGRITAKEGGGARNADVEGEVAKYGMRIGLEMIQAEGHDKVLVVICDTVQPMYAVAVVEPGKTNWPETMQQTVVFKPYRKDEIIPATGSNIWEIRNGETSFPGEEP